MVEMDSWMEAFWIGVVTGTVPTMVVSVIRR